MSGQHTGVSGFTLMVAMRLSTMAQGNMSEGIFQPIGLNPIGAFGGRETGASFTTCPESTLQVIAVSSTSVGITERLQTHRGLRRRCRGLSR